jgi:hypothetical protein
MRATDVESVSVVVSEVLASDRKLFPDVALDQELFTVISIPGKLFQSPFHSQIKIHI